MYINIFIYIYNYIYIYIYIYIFSVSSEFCYFFTIIISTFPRLHIICSTHVAAKFGHFLFKIISKCRNNVNYNVFKADHKRKLDLLK